MGDLFLHLVILDRLLGNRVLPVHLDLMAKTVHQELLESKDLLVCLAFKVFPDHQVKKELLEIRVTVVYPKLDHQASLGNLVSEDPKDQLDMERTVEMVREEKLVCLDPLDLREQWVLLATAILQLATLPLQEENSKDLLRKGLPSKRRKIASRQIK